MKHSDCLNQQDLTLLHYRDPELTVAEAEQHLAGCPDCRTRYEALCRDLQALPDPAGEVDGVAVTRLVARVSEHLPQRRRSWMPAIGGALVTAAALLVTVILWQPSERPEPSQSGTIQLADQPAQFPDADLLEDLELLNELELLRQIEGV